MSLKADIYFLWTFFWECVYNFFRWTPCVPRMFTFNGRLDDKVVVITGCTSGIGRETAKYFALKGAKVIMACRDLNKAREVKQELRAKMMAARLECYECNLGSNVSIKQFVESLDTEPHIDILINNAAIMSAPFDRTVDGFETHFAVNYLGHFLLTNLLLGKLKNSQHGGRVINVTSSSHIRASDGIDLDDINYQREAAKYSPHLAYAQSKLAMILFTRELAKRITNTSVHVYALYPGMARTNLFRYFNGLYKFTWTITGWFVFLSPYLASQTILFCALDKDTGIESGHYYSNCKLVADRNLSPIATDYKAAEKLWDFSVKSLGLDAQTNL